eukprot:Selendium_serpulae@DN6426_c3_g2_i6.p1
MLLEDMMGNLRRKDEADQQSKHCSAGVSQEQRANRFSLTSTKIAIVSHGAQQEKLPHYQQSTTHSRELSLSATCEYESQAISFINSKGEATINSEIAERIIKRKEKTDTDEQNSVSNANTGDVFMSAVNQNVEKGITGTTMASSGIIPTTVSSGSGEPSFENVANDCSSPNRDHMSLSDVQRPERAVRKFLRFLPFSVNANMCMKRMTLENLCHRQHHLHFGPFTHPMYSALI